MNIIPNIKNDKQLILVVLILLLITISFETAQQLFYIKRFDLAQNVTFFDVFFNQSYRWVVWLIMSYFLVVYVKSISKKNNFGIFDFYKYTIVITGLVLIDILIILWLNN